MNANEFKNLQDNAANLEKEIALLRNRQPDCRKSSGSYGDEFSEYRREVETVLQLNSHERYRLHNILFSKEKIAALKTTLNALVELRNEIFDILSVDEIERYSRVMWNLICLKSEAETDKSQFFQSLEEIEETIEHNNSVLWELLEPTHSWESLESGKKKRCTKCLKEFETGQKQPELHPPDKGTLPWIDDEHKQRIQRLRDSEIL